LSSLRKDLNTGKAKKFDWVGQSYTQAKAGKISPAFVLKKYFNTPIQKHSSTAACTACQHPLIGPQKRLHQFLHLQFFCLPWLLLLKV